MSNRQHDDFLELLAEHQGRLTAYVYAIVQNMADTEDVLQQTILVLWNKFEDYQPDTEFVRWAMKVAQLEAFRFLRTKRRSRVIFNETLVSQLADEHFAEAATDDPRQGALRHCLSKLGDDDRRLIDECYSNNSTITEIATSRGRSLQSLSNSLRRVRRALLDCVERTLSRENRT